MWVFGLCLMIGLACGFRLPLLPFCAVSVFVFATLLGHGLATDQPSLLHTGVAVVVLQIGYFGSVLIQALWLHRLHRGSGSGG